MQKYGKMYTRDIYLFFGTQHNRNSVENKPASLLVASWGKALNRIPLFLCGRQMVGPSRWVDWWPSLTKDMQTEHELICVKKALIIICPC